MKELEERFYTSDLSPHASLDKFMSGDISEVVPPLPIPNRTVKRLSADDSADCLCESRSSPDAP